MKKLTLLLTIITNLAVAQVKNGEAVPDLNFKTILNAPVKTATLGNLKGKIVLIDFWATWCGSCLVAMPHLQQLQKKYPGKLQINRLGQRVHEECLGEAGHALQKNMTAREQGNEQSLDDGLLTDDDLADTRTNLT